MNDVTLMADAAALAALFRPRSLAVYGASSREPTRLGNQLFRNALAAGLPAVAVNPRGGTIEGREARPSLDEPVDLALISVPASAAGEALTDAAEGGCSVAVVLSSGFKEAGADGAEREARLTAIAREAGIRLVGPNCMGVVSDLGSTWCNASYFWSVPESRGPLAFVSQSGAMGGMFFAEVRTRGSGFSRFISLGNAADVNETDVLEWLGDDEATGVIALFCEQIVGGRRFVEVARDVSVRKPIVVLKAGKGETGTRAARSHTGSIAGSHGAARAAFARAGVIEAPDSDAFFDTLAMVSAGVRPTATCRLAILTVSGGPGVLAADAAERLGAEMPAPSEGACSRLRELLPEFAALTNPIDLTPQCAPACFGPAVDTVFDDPAFDAVVMIDCGLDVDEFGSGVARAAKRTGRPVAAFVLDVPNVAAALDRAGIPRFTSPERAVSALIGVGR